MWIVFSVECQPGEYPNASDTTQCIPCEIGFYKDVAGAMNCTQCQPNFSTVETGSNDTLLCHGKLISKPLLVSFVGSKHQQQKQCFFSTWVSQYIFISAICGLGQAPNISNTSQCIDCEIGFYSDVEAADQCTQCDPNFSTVNPSSESVLECIGMHLTLQIIAITSKSIVDYQVCTNANILHTFIFSWLWSWVLPRPFR